MTHLHRSWIIIGYVCYAIGLFAFFTYLKFPHQQARAFIVAALRQAGVEQVRIGGVQPLFPVGLNFKDVSLNQEVGGQSLELVRFPALQLRLRALQPFANFLRIGFDGSFYGGNVQGAVDWEQNGQGPRIGIRADFRDIWPAAHPLVEQWGPQVFQGKLKGNMTVQLVDHRWRQGSGRLVLQGDGGSIAGIEVKGLRLPELVYEQLTGELSLQQQTLVVKDFLLRGRDWQLEIQGSITLQEIVRQSPVDFTLRVRASETLESQLGMLGAMLKQRRDRRGFSAFKIGGTLENPSVML